MKSGSLWVPEVFPECLDDGCAGVEFRLVELPHLHAHVRADVEVDVSAAVKHLRADAPAGDRLAEMSYCVGHFMTEEGEGGSFQVQSLILINVMGLVMKMKVNASALTAKEME